MDIEDYDHIQAEMNLLLKLQKAEAAIANSNNWLSLDELKSAMEE